MQWHGGDEDADCKPKLHFSTKSGRKRRRFDGTRYAILES
jgi:hypothetical protein